MPELIQLVLTKPERDAIASDLRGYANIHADLGADILDAYATSDDLEPPVLRKRVEQTVGSHAAVAEECGALAAALESGEPTPLTPAAMRLIREALDNTHAGELPSEVAQIAAFVRVAHLQEPTAEFVAVSAPMQPHETPEVASALMRNTVEVDQGIDWLGDRLGMKWAHAHALTDDATERERDVTLLRDAWLRHRDGGVPDEMKNQVEAVLRDRETRLTEAKEWHRRHDPVYFSNWERRNGFADTVGDGWSDERALIRRHLTLRAATPDTDQNGIDRATTNRARDRSRRFGWRSRTRKQTRNDPQHGRGL